MTVSELWRKLAKAPDDAAVFMITLRDSKFDEVDKVEFSRANDGKILSVLLIGSSTRDKR